MRCSFAVRVSALEAAGVPRGPINTLEQVFEDPQVRHREMKVTTPHPLAGSVAMVRNPIRLSATPIEYRSPRRRSASTRRTFSARCWA